MSDLELHGLTQQPRSNARSRAPRTFGAGPGVGLDRIDRVDALPK